VKLVIFAVYYSRNGRNNTSQTYQMYWGMTENRRTPQDTLNNHQKVLKTVKL